MQLNVTIQDYASAALIRLIFGLKSRAVVFSEASG
jgi:hypothetical protein